MTIFSVRVVYTSPERVTVENVEFARGYDRFLSAIDSFLGSANSAVDKHGRIFERLSLLLIDQIFPKSH